MRKRSSPPASKLGKAEGSLAQHRRYTADIALLSDLLSKYEEAPPKTRPRSLARLVDDARARLPEADAEVGARRRQKVIDFLVGLHRMLQVRHASKLAVPEIKM